MPSYADHPIIHQEHRSHLNAPAAALLALRSGRLRLGAWMAEGDAPGEMSPLDFMLSVMRDPSATRGERIEMAKAAAPYFHGRVGAAKGRGGEAEPEPPPLVRLIERRVIDPEPATHPDPADG